MRLSDCPTQIPCLMMTETCPSSRRGTMLPPEDMADEAILWARPEWWWTHLQLSSFRGKASCGECLWHSREQVRLSSDNFAVRSQDGGALVLTCICLQNMMRLRYAGLQDNMLDQEDADHNIIPGSWWDGVCFQDMDNVRRGNRTTRTVKLQRLYIKHYLNSQTGAVQRQNDMI